MKNFIPINRKLFNNFLWTERRKFSKFEAWLDLLQLVSFSDDNKQLISGIICKWNRGQYPISISFLMKRWKWTEKPTRNFIKILENDKMIIIEKSNKWSMLTICNYDTYNETGQTEGKQKSIKGQTEVNQRSTIKEGKEYKEIKEDKEVLSSNSIFNIFDLKIRYLKNKKVVKAVVENTDNKFKNEKHLEEQLEKFVKELNERNDKMKTEYDFSFHFRNWNKKQKSSYSGTQKEIKLNASNPNK